jgi:hypothetical protein
MALDLRFSDEVLRDERTELERGRESRMYDVSAWSLPLALGLEAYTARDVPGDLAEASVGADPTDEDLSDQAPKAPGDQAAFGYLIPIDDSRVYPALARLLAEDIKLRVARKSFTVQGRRFPRGAILVRRHENGEDLWNVLARVLEETAVEVFPLDTALADDGPDLGGGEYGLLQTPRVAIASQWPVRTTSFGEVWYLLDDRLGLRSSPINVQDLGRLDLRQYNVLVLPSSSNLNAVLGENGQQALRTWVESGGTLIAIGGSASALASEGSDLSQVRDRSDVLDKLDVYEEAIDREIAARSISIDRATIWGEDPPAADAQAPAVEDAEGQTPDDGAADSEKLKRSDEWGRRFSPQGAIASATLDEEHWLCFGLGAELPVLVAGSHVLMSMPPVQTPVRLKDEDSLRLAGLIWPEARERLAHGAWATVERRGNGQVILFASDPFFRAQWEGTGRLLQNAILLGPGLGTNPPLPW